MTTSSVVTFSGAGSFQFCAWLDSGSSYIATTSGTFTVASPVGSISSVTVPSPVPRGRPFLVTVTGQTEVKRELLTTWRPTSQPPCAATPKLDPAYASSDIRGVDVFGAFAKQIELTLDTPGSYRFCS